MRKPNGTIMVMAPDHTGAARKVIDLKVTQRFPIFNLNSKSGMFKADGSIWDTSDYRHLSIPPDLRVHLTRASTDTGRDRHFLIRNRQTSPDGQLLSPFLHLLTFISAPVIQYPEPRHSSQPRRTWHQAVLVGLMGDKQYSPDRTRVFLDIFVHQAPCAPASIVDMPLARENMRLPFGERCVLGPHRFQDLIRGTDMSTQFFSSLRFGYCEMEVDESCYIHCPLNEREEMSDESNSCEEGTK